MDLDVFFWVWVPCFVVLLAQFPGDLSWSWTFFDFF